MFVEKRYVKRNTIICVWSRILTNVVLTFLGSYDYLWIFTVPKVLKALDAMREVVILPSNRLIK